MFEGAIRAEAEPAISAVAAGVDALLDLPLTSLTDGELGPCWSRSSVRPAGSLKARRG